MMKQPPPIEMPCADATYDPIEDNTMKQSSPLEAPRVDLAHDPIEAKVNHMMPPAQQKLTDGPMIQSNDEPPRKMLTLETNPTYVSSDENGSGETNSSSDKADGPFTDRPKSFAEIQ